MLCGCNKKSDFIREIRVLSDKANVYDMKYQEITDQIICCFYNVYNNLGYGFLEKNYENALLIELGVHNLAAISQPEISVTYRNQMIGRYYADIIVENKIIVEIKACKVLLPEHEAQLLNYLKATELEVGLLLNFGSSPEVKRKVFDNDRKDSGHYVRKYLDTDKI